MDEKLDGWMEKLDGWMEKWMNGWKKWMDGPKSGWMKKWVDEKTTNYIISLPNGTNTTVYDAAMAVCPDEIEQMEFMDLFDLFYAVVENVEKTDTVLDMSEHDGREEGLFFKTDFIRARIPIDGLVVFGGGSVEGGI